MESDNDFFGFMALAKELVTSNRPLRLRLDLPGGMNDDMLLPQRVFGSETVCGGVEYRVLCVSASVQLPLKEMIAVPAALQFVTDRGDLRSVCGIVTEASSGDSDGGLASYQLVLRDALSVLEKRVNTRVFRNMDEVEIVQRILNEWRQKSPIVGQLYNQTAAPAALSSAGELPGNRYLSGMKSREVQGGRGSQLKFDDTTGQISAQLASDHAQAQLNLGYFTSPRLDGSATL